MSRVRKETVITINRAWATPSGESECIDIVLPQSATDYMITNYDDAETLYIVVDGKLEEYDDRNHNFKRCGEKDKEEK